MKISKQAIADAVICFSPLALLVFVSIYSLATPVCRRENVKENDGAVKTERVKNEPVSIEATGSLTKKITVVSKINFVLNN